MNQSLKKNTVLGLKDSTVKTVQLKELYSINAPVSSYYE